MKHSSGRDNDRINSIRCISLCRNISNTIVDNSISGRRNDIRMSSIIGDSIIPNIILLE